MLTKLILLLTSPLHSHSCIYGTDWLSRSYVNRSFSFYCVADNRKSIFEEAMKVLMGESRSHDQSDQSEETVAGEQLKTSAVGEDTASKADVSSTTTMESRPDSLPGVLRRKQQPISKLATPSVDVKKPRNLSDQCIIALLWGHVLARVWLHIWLIMIIVPLPLGIWLIKKLGKDLRTTKQTVKLLKLSFMPSACQLCLAGSCR